MKLGNIRIICNDLHRFGFLSIANYTDESLVGLSKNSQKTYKTFVAPYLGLGFCPYAREFSWSEQKQSKYGSKSTTV